MKQKKLLLLAAAVTIMMVGCEPEKVVVPEAPGPTPTGPTGPISLVGTVWNRHLDEWQTISGGQAHIIYDYDMSFLTDSTGTWHSYNTPTQSVPYTFDDTWGFYYWYDSLTFTGMIEDSVMVSMGGDVRIYDFRYDAEQNALLIYSSSSDTTVYTRVQ